MNCPKVISNALHQVQGKVTRLVHDSENQFANYHYVSIDAYYEAVRPWLTEAGLMLIPNEREAQISPDGKTQKVVFEFWVMHKDGEIWEVPIQRTVYLPYTGAQSSGSALSYAEKFVMRTLFKIPTGEVELESQHPAMGGASAPPVQDADAMSSVDGRGQDAEIDYNYSGPPYRIFTANKAVKQTFTDIRPWGTMLKTMVSKATDSDKPRLLAANEKEIDRVREEVSEDGSLHIKTRNTLIKSIDSIRPADTEIQKEGTNAPEA